MAKGNNKGCAAMMSRYGSKLLILSCVLMTLFYFRPDIDPPQARFEHGSLGKGSLRRTPAPAIAHASIAEITPAPAASQASAMKGSLGEKSAPASSSPAKGRWTAAQIVSYMEAHPSRAYFSQLFKQGGFKVGMEVGVADGRFSEHMLTSGHPATWRMCEPFPNDALISRYPDALTKERTDEQKSYARDRAKQEKEIVVESWASRGIGKDVKFIFMEHYSTDKEVISSIPKGSIDFVYLDGAHDYENVKKELEPYWQMIAPGGILAGHDYQNHGQKGLKCKGCDNVPRARPYTENGIRHGKPANGVAKDMQKVVSAVQEWVDDNHPEVRLHHTMENFTRESLAADGLDYELVITNTYNPSWYFIKDA